MSITLIESRRRRERKLGGTAASVLLHAAVITFGVFVTARAGERVANPHTGDLFTLLPPLPPPSPPPAKPAPVPTEALASLPRKGFQTLEVPRNIPDELPAIDLSHAITNPDDFSGVGPRGGRANGVDDDGIDSGAGSAYFEYQVEKPALAHDGNPSPRYPSMLERSRVEGEVVVQFVVDTAGRADMSTLEILRSSNDLFSASLQSVLPRWRFFPAEVGGRRVRQIVQIPFRFVAPRSQ